MTHTVTKPEVPQHFDRVAARYDLLNTLNPGYRKHLSWSAERMHLASSGRILDLCCGTGLSTQALRKAYPDADITGMDASAGMLELAQRKSELGDVHWTCGDAGAPAESGVIGPFDGVLVAYGIRNLSDPDLALRNILELLRPGGVLAVHEYSVADSRLSKLVWNTVASAIIIPAGAAMTRDPGLFRYLKRSVNEFDGAAAFRERLARAGFVGVVERPMDGWQRGIVHTFLARRPE